MPLDPNIALQVGQPVKPIDPMAAYGQVLTLKHLMDQQKMQGLQEEALRGKVARENQNLKLEGAIKSTQLLAKNAAAFEQVPPDQRAAVWPQWRQRMLSQGLTDLPEAVPDENLVRAMASLDTNPEKLMEFAQKREEQRALSEAQSRIFGDRPAGAAPAAGAAAPVTAAGAPGEITMPTQTVSAYSGPSMNPDNHWRLADAYRRDPRLAGTKHAAEAQDAALKLLADRRAADSSGLHYATGADGKLRVFRNGQLTGDDPYDLGRDPNAKFWSGPDGQPIPNKAVLDQEIEARRAGATNVNVGAYPKELEKQDAQAVSDARKGAEQAASAASDARAIAQILKGQNGGNWTAMQAALGGWLPGTPYAKVTSVVSLAEGIRARAAPALRVPGSGAMSDFETKQLLGIFPQLLQSDDGRELAARVLERVADRQAIAADIKDEMVRSGKYSVKKFNDAVRAQFGDGLLNPEEKKLMTRLQGDGRTPGGKTPSAPTFDINGLPDPAKNSGKVIESERGVRLRSDGKKWVPMQ